MIEKWAEKVVFVQNVRGLTCVFETFDSPTRVNYAKNVNKSKKNETFCICLTFFYYLCRRPSQSRRLRSVMAKDVRTRAGR